MNDFEIRDMIAELMQKRGCDSCYSHLSETVTTSLAEEIMTIPYIREAIDQKRQKLTLTANTDWFKKQTEKPVIWTLNSEDVS